MIPKHFRSLFWDTNLEEFDPAAYPVYTVERVLEHGDEEAVAWLLKVFSKEQIRAVLRTDQHLSPRSANFWALFFELPEQEVAALRGEANAGR
ncbi:MAG: hypothetical protein HYU27_03770 [Acidobacteria bacterium]|nr:hypothetical protein [Acidobacteriota bacterium]